MRTFFFSLLSMFLFASCDDGDVIVTSFDFDEIDLKYCGEVGDYVFFKINNSNFESFSFRLRSQDSILNNVDTLEYKIDAVTHVVNYRMYNQEIPDSYFCNLVPSTNPTVKKEYQSTDGKATVFTRIIDTIFPPEGSIEDTSYVYFTTIKLNNLKLESNSEIIIQETLELGSVINTAN